MSPLAREAGDRHISFGVRYFLGDEALNSLARVRAAIKKRRHFDLPVGNYKATKVGAEKVPRSFRFGIGRQLWELPP